MGTERVVVLSTTMLVEQGMFEMTKITLSEARILTERAENFCGHETVKLLEIDPAQSRKVCGGYDIAVVIKPHGRMEFGREYTVEDIEDIGYDIFKIRRIKQ